MKRSSTLSAVPYDVRLVAAVSRLVDLHQSRRESGVYVPETQERGGYHLSLALLLLDTLREIELDRGPNFVAVGEVLEHLRKRVSSVTAEDLDFVIATITTEREIRFGAEDGKGSLDFGLTRETTPLLEQARGFAQIQLTENSRLLLRIAAMKESWLYSDLDAERLVKAIERGQFDDIPRFCRMMILELASKGKQLSGALERPTLSELRDMLIEEGSLIAEALREATEVVKRACSLIFDARTSAAFAAWKVQSGVAYSIGNLQTEIELVMQNVEALSRRFVVFLETAQRARTTGGTGIPFLEIVDSLTDPESAPDAKRLEALFAGVMPWGIFAGFFHPSALVGAIDFSTLGEDEAVKPASSFTLEPGQGSGYSRFLDFLLRNRTLVVEKLRKCPSSFSEIVLEAGFILEPGETPADFFGVYAAPENLDGDGFRIMVGFTGDTFDAWVGGSRFAGSNPMMFITENEI
jgi:hypothetical protein